MEKIISKVKSTNKQELKKWLVNLSNQEATIRKEDVLQILNNFDFEESTKTAKSSIKRFIRIQIEKIHIEINCLLESNNIDEETRILGRISAFSDTIKFARICENYENEGIDF